MNLFPDVGEGSNGQLGNLLSAILYGGKCLSYEKLTVDDAPVVDLTAIIPAGARSAVITIEAAAAEADEPRVVRFTEDGSDPTDTDGMPLGDNGTVEVKGSDNLANFKIIGITAALTHTLHIQFYGAA